MATVAATVLTAWLFVSCLVNSEASVFADTSSNLRSSLFSLITCPSTKGAACATDTVPAESRSGVSLAQCTNGCNRINGCHYYNYFEANDSDKYNGRGYCALFTNPPLNMSSKPLCKLFTRKSIDNIVSLDNLFDAATKCSYPFTNDGSLYYSCTRNQSVVGDECVPYYCLANNTSPVKCYPSDFTAKNVAMNVTIPQNTNKVTLISVFGWIIVMSRINSNFPTNQSWNTYETGFGEILSNFWLGLNDIYKLTNKSVNGGVTYKLRVEVQEDATNKWFSQEYSFFYLDGPDNMYALHTSTSSTGDAGDGINTLAKNTADGQERIINGKQFIAIDRDNGRYCPKEVQGGWWYLTAERGACCSSSRLLSASTDFHWMPDGSVPCVLQACRMMVKIVV